MTPKISVIMLTYNREKFVGRMIECILEQTFQDFEFIIVDNGSSDRSGVIAEEYARNDSRIQVIHRECGNIGSGRNAGLDIATGEWIAFVDDDDLCRQDFLDFLLKLAVEENADISICGATDKRLDERLLMNAEEALKVLFWRRLYNVQFPTKLIHRKMFEGVRFDEGAKYDDIELMPQIMARASRVAYHGLPKYTFERHESNHSAWTTNHKLIRAEILEEYFDVYRKRTKWLCGEFPQSAMTWKYFEWSFMISMVDKITRLKLEDCYELRKELIEVLSRHKREFLGCGEILDFEKKWVEELL